MPTTFRASRSMRRMLALPVVLGASVAAMSAQTGAQTSAASATQSSEATTGSNYNLQLPARLDLPAFSSSSSSSGADQAPAEQTVAANSVDHFSFLNAQYGRQRYGRPRYRGGNTNEDGSEKYTFFVGAGFGQPLGNTYHYFTPNYGFQVGGGRNFSKHFGTMIQFDYDHFDLNKRTLGNQAYIYTGDAVASDNGIDATNHIWSFSVDPTYTFYSGEGLGAYVVAGVGFYHKVTDFTAPQTGFYCDGYSYCGDVQYQGTFDQYVSNAVGFNGGFGLTYKFSRFSNERLYAEARYVFIDNSQRYGYTAANVNTTTYNGYNAFPANSNRTTYLPIKFGIRF
jgi:hypothetical protein